MSVIPYTYFVFSYPCTHADGSEGYQDYELELVQCQQDPDDFEFGDLYRIEQQEPCDDVETMSVLAWLEEHCSGQMSQKWDELRQSEEFNMREYHHDIGEFLESWVK